MDTGYKLQVKIGASEFSAEGPEGTVKEAYKQFLEAISSMSQVITQTPSKPQGAGNGFPALGEVEIDQALLDRVYAVRGDIVSLRLLPPESSNRPADAAILLLYGFRRLLSIPDVPVTRLNEGLRQSGVSVDRLDRFIGVHSGLYMRGGTRSGGRYTLNNQGVVQAENWLRTWFN